MKPIFVAYGDKPPKGYKLPDGYVLEYKQSPSVYDPAQVVSGILLAIPISQKA